MAEKLKDSMIMEWFTRVDGPVDDDLRLVQRTRNACFNVETWTTPANGGRIYVVGACCVDPKSIGGRERT